jgi:hypothetical protein
MQLLFTLHLHRQQSFIVFSDRLSNSDEKWIDKVTNIEISHFDKYTNFLHMQQAPTLFLLNTKNMTNHSVTRDTYI